MRDSVATDPNIGNPKSASFGSALRGAIRAVYGTNQRFAVELGVSEGRVSQLIRGPESIRSQTLKRILAVFEDSTVREQIHRAWVAEFASPSDAMSESQTTLSVLERVERVGLGISARRALELSVRQRRIEQDPRLKHQLLAKVVQLYLRLDHSAHALRAVQQLEREARADGDPLDIMAAMWLRGNALRTVEPTRVSDIIESHVAAITYADAVKPSGGERLRIWKRLRSELERDFALHVVKIQAVARVNESKLQAAYTAANHAIAEAMDESAVWIGLEVRARVEITLGRLSDAEDTLEEIKQMRGIKPAELDEKAALTQARLLLAQGETTHAEALLRRIAAKCLEVEDLHHFRIADQHLVEILLGR